MAYNGDALSVCCGDCRVVYATHWKYVIHFLQLCLISIMVYVLIFGKLGHRAGWFFWCPEFVGFLRCGYAYTVDRR